MTGAQDTSSIAARRRVVLNRLQFERLVEVAGDLNSAGRFEEAALLAEAAADFAWYNQTGTYSEPDLESVLVSIGTRLPAGTVEHHRPPQRVLHVLTEAHHSAGGHVRMAWRWIEHDAGRSHSVVITNQPGHEGPSPVLAQMAAMRGGSVEVLNATTGSRLQRAARLRKLAQSFDLVVLHVHPYDTIPVIALAGAAGRPPTIFFNHADHVFWLGVTITDVLASWRQAGTDLAVRRRGMAAERCCPLPLVIDRPNTTGHERQAARRALSIADGEVMLLSAASAYKYAPVNGLGFLDLVLPVLEAEPKAVLYVLGGGDKSDWTDAVNRSGGRLRPLGSQPSMEPFLAAADIYLDSFPFASVTSFLEAAAWELPTLGFGPDPATRDLLNAEDYSHDGITVQCHDVDAYRATLRSWIGDASTRTRAAERSRAAAEATNMAPAWTSHLEELYERLAEASATTHSAAVAGGPVAPRNEDDVEVDAVISSIHQAGGLTRPVEHVLMSHGIDPSVVPYRHVSPQSFRLVMVPTDDAEALLTQLESIVEHSADEMYRVTLVDRGLGPGVQQLLAQLEGDVDVIRLTPDTGYTDAAMHAVTRATGEWVVFLSPQFLAAPLWLDVLAAQFGAGADVATSEDLVSMHAETFTTIGGFGAGARTPGDALAQLIHHAGEQQMCVAVSPE